MAARGAVEERSALAEWAETAAPLEETEESEESAERSKSDEEGSGVLARHHHEGEEGRGGAHQSQVKQRRDDDGHDVGLLVGHRAGQFLNGRPLTDAGASRPWPWLRGGRWSGLHQEDFWGSLTDLK